MEKLDTRNDIKIATWLINLCLLSIVLGAWIIQKWPRLASIELGLVAASSLIGLLALAAVKIREGRAETVEREPQLQADYHSIANKLLSETVIRHRLVRLQNEVLQRELSVRAADRLRTVLDRARTADTMNQVYQFWHYSTNQATQNHIDRNVVLSSGNTRHVILTPQSKNYRVTIGVVEIEVNGEETRISVKDNKKVIIDTPIGVRTDDAETSDRKALERWSLN
ncbi:MAG: hypothetical protein ACHP7N_03960 [Caulobacterales bacterium]